eukprot:SAG11_NODE_16944_length_533_cov_0.718894_1_plen_44_part_10
MFAACCAAIDSDTTLEEQPIVDDLTAQTTVSRDLKALRVRDLRI